MEGSVHVRFTKWDGSLHWHFDMRRVHADEYGTWLWAPAGTVLRRGDEHAEASERSFLKLITDGEWWTAIWTHTGRIYVDVATPARWEDETVHMVDLDLDIVRHPEGNVTVEDEDEFEEHRVAFAYPEQIIDRARTTTAALALAVEAGREPFGRAGFELLAGKG